MPHKPELKPIHLLIDEQEFAQIERYAAQTNHKSVSDYVRQLIAEDIAKREELEDEWSSEEQIEELKALYPQYVINGELDIQKIQDEIIEDFRQGWHEVMTGQTRPIEDILAELDEED